MNWKQILKVTWLLVAVMLTPTLATAQLLSVRGIPESRAVPLDKRLLADWVSETSDVCSSVTPCGLQFREEHSRQRMLFQAHDKSVGTALFKVKMAKIDDVYYLDLELDDLSLTETSCTTTATAVHLLPLHSIWRLEFDGKGFSMTWLVPDEPPAGDSKWLKIDQESTYIFAGTSEELGAWLQRSGKDARGIETFVATPGRLPEQTSQAPPPATDQRPVQEKK